MTNRQQRSARTATLVAALALAAVGLGTASSLPSTARFTDSESTAGTPVSSGSVVLTTSGGASAGTWLGSVALTPGESAYQGLLVTNAGSLRLRYSVSATSEDVLAAALEVDVRALPAATDCTSATYTTGSTASSATAPFGTSAGVDLVGDPAAGAQAGDRELAAGLAERLCLKVTFPTGTGLGRAANGTSAAATVEVRAENA
jgi:hypothetical protein